MFEKKFNKIFIILTKILIFRCNRGSVLAEERAFPYYLQIFRAVLGRSLYFPTGDTTADLYRI